MYAWIWRKLPFGLYGKISGSLVLIGVAVALLWFVVFPWAEPILPFDDVQVGNPGGPGDLGGGGDPAPEVSPGSTDDPHYVPYETTEPSPSDRG